jgi:hypothetical protein
MRRKRKRKREKKERKRKNIYHSGQLIEGIEKEKEETEGNSITIDNTAIK